MDKDKLILLNKQLKLKELTIKFPLIDQPPYGLLPSTLKVLRIDRIHHTGDFNSTRLIHIANSCPNLTDFTLFTYYSFSLTDLSIILLRLER